jgi:hypothetical protein
MMGFVRENALLGATAAWALLAAKLFEAGQLRGGRKSTLLCDLIQETVTRQSPVEALVPRALAFDLNPGGPMREHHASGGLVDVLTSMATRADKAFLNVRLANVQLSHSASQEIFGGNISGWRVHDRSLMQVQKFTKHPPS